jgi:hypothetical protein
LNDQAGTVYEEMVQQVLARHGSAPPSQALCALLWLLRDRHLAAVREVAHRAFREDFELPDPRINTVAEDLRDAAANLAACHEVGTNGQPNGTTRAGISGMQAVADLLSEVILLSDCEAKPRMRL